MKKGRGSRWTHDIKRSIQLGEYGRATGSRAATGWEAVLAVVCSTRILMVVGRGNRAPGEGDRRTDGGDCNALRSNVYPLRETGARASARRARLRSPGRTSRGRKHAVGEPMCLRRHRRRATPRGAREGARDIPCQPCRHYTLTTNTPHPARTKIACPMLAHLP